MQDTWTAETDAVRLLHRNFNVPWPSELSEEDLPAALEANAR